jgi:transposase
VANLFWLPDEQWAVIGPFMPTDRPGARRVDDRRVISGIVHVLKTGGRWRDCPAAYGPHTTVYNRYNRWSRRGFWRAMLAALAEAGRVAETAALDSAYVKAHRSAHGGKGGQRLIADRGYDADRLRRDLRGAGTTPIIPGTRSRKRPVRYDRRRCKDRWRIEAAFCRLKDFRRVATRYDTLAANFASAAALAAVIAFWC